MLKNTLEAVEVILGFGHCDLEGVKPKMFDALESLSYHENTDLQDKAKDLL